MRAVGLALLFSLLALPAPSSAQPPADGWVIWQSTREEGRSELYIGRADGSEVKRLTRSGAHRVLWAPDGRWIAYTDEATGVYLIRPDGSETTHLSPAGWPAFWLHDNGGLVVGIGTEYHRFDPETKEKQLLFAQADFPAVAGTTFIPNSMTHDNRYLLVGSHLYMNGYTGANGSFKSGFSAVMLDLVQKDKVYFVGSGCWPFTPPQGDMVYHICGEGCPAYPDIMRLDLKDRDTRASYTVEVSYPDADWGHEYNPRVSTDGKWIVYMTSTGCHDGLGCDYEVFMHQLGTGPSERIRVTNNPTFDGYPDMYVGPAWKKSAGPHLLVTPRLVTLHAAAGAVTPGQVVAVKNDGAGGALGTLRVTAVEPQAPWLALTTTPTSFTAGVGGGAALFRGRHQTVVTVVAEGIPGVSLEVPVTLIADDSYPAAPPPDAGQAATTPPPDASAADAAAPAGTDAPTAGRGDSGCGCHVGGPPSSGLTALAACVLPLGIAGLRRLRRRVSAA
jgi:hypothetical protein